MMLTNNRTALIEHLLATVKNVDGLFSDLSLLGLKDKWDKSGGEGNISEQILQQVLIPRCMPNQNAIEQLEVLGRCDVTYSIHWSEGYVNLWVSIEKDFSPGFCFLTLHLNGESHNLALTDDFKSNAVEDVLSKSVQQLWLEQEILKAQAQKRSWLQEFCQLTASKRASSSSAELLMRFREAFIARPYFFFSGIDLRAEEEGQTEYSINYVEEKKLNGVKVTLVLSGSALHSGNPDLQANEIEDVWINVNHSGLTLTSSETEYEWHFSFSQQEWDTIGYRLITE